MWYFYWRVFESNPPCRTRYANEVVLWQRSNGVLWGIKEDSVLIFVFYYLYQPLTNTLSWHWLNYSLAAPVKIFGDIRKPLWVKDNISLAWLGNPVEECLEVKIDKVVFNHRR